MATTIKLNLKENEYKMLKSFAKKENRSLSNLLKTAVIKFIEESRLIDDFEMQEILKNSELIRKLKTGSRDAKNKLGKFID